MATACQYDRSRLEESCDLLFKMVIIGDAGVGKASLIRWYVYNEFSDGFLSLTGYDFKTKTVEMDEKIIKLQMWDTAGQERFRPLCSSFYRGSHGVILVFDLTNMESFQNLRDWFNETDKYCGHHVAKLLVGNKSDMKDKRVVTYEMAQEFASQMGIPYLETSAKTATNVEQAFMTMSAEMKKVFDTGAFKNPPKPIKITEGKYVKSWYPCVC